MTKEHCRHLPCTLNNLVSVLRVAFPNLSQVDNEDLIIAYGNTGSGKSTIFSSLVYGPDSLTVKTIEIESKVPVDDKGGIKTVVKKERVIDQKIQREVFQIGHSTHQSQTFFPHFIKDDATGIVFADIAGMKDTDGDLVELVNCFVNKSIFKRAKSLKFLVPMTINQLKENRGMGVREQVRVLKNICNTSSLDEFAHCMLPILTKCRPNDENLDIDEKRSNLLQQFKEEIQAEMTDFEEYKKTEILEEEKFQQNFVQNDNQNEPDEENVLNEEINELDFEELEIDTKQVQLSE